MDPELKQPEYSDVSAASGEVELESPTITVEEGGPLTKLSTTSETNEQWRQFGEKAYAFLSSLPDYIGNFFAEYRRPIITLGLIFGSIVSVKLTLALLDAINDIPLLSPSLELIGLGYTVWFIYRYLLRASNRQELATELNNLKDQIIGRGLPKS